MSNPFKDFTLMTTDDLLKENQKYTKNENQDLGF